MTQEAGLNNPVVQKYLSELVGPEGMQVVAAEPDGEVTDEELAEELDLEVNTVRRTLIHLNENNLADYRRVRDEESGWLTYLWTFHYDRIPEQLLEEMQQLRDVLDKRLQYEEENQFYRCQECIRRHPFDKAMDNQFNCVECGNDLEPMDMEPVKEAMRTRLNELEEELDNVEES